jgi:hypothetical protein
MTYFFAAGDDGAVLRGERGGWWRRGRGGGGGRGLGGRVFRGMLILCVGVEVYDSSIRG